jgi:hypothetical protein
MESFPKCVGVLLGILTAPGDTQCLAQLNEFGPGYTSIGPGMTEDWATFCGRWSVNHLFESDQATNAYGA